MAENTERLATASLIYNLESALGRITRTSTLTVADVPASLVQTIRQLSRNPIPDNPTLEQLLENTYLSEAFELAKQATQGTNLATGVQELKTWCEASGAFALRNVIAHPNRRWMPHYFHLAQAMATHPSVYTAELRELAEAHKAVQAGTFEPPPNSWFLAVREFEVPNNLAEVRRHQGLTTFYGRKAEKQMLRKHLANERVPALALVGVGGLGKTALVIDTLHELARDANASADIRRILVLTAKTQVVGPTGPQQIIPDFTSASEVAGAIARELLGSPAATLQEAIDVHRDDKLILCLDNLEGALLENPALIDGLMLDLPAKWKVIVTSRIPVNTAFAQQLARMTAGDAKALIFGCVRELGIPTPIADVDAQTLAAKADTPLAIRLTLQGVAGGVPLSTAFGAAATITAENAYSQLLEALTDDARALTESLYAIGEPVPLGSLGLVMKWELSRVQESVALLRRFNLLSSTDENTCALALRESLAEYLRRSPLDLESRNNGHREWQQIKGNLQVSPVTELQDSGAFGDVEDTLLRISLHKILISVENEVDASRLLAELDRLETLHKRAGAIHRVKARVLQEQGDETGELRELEAAISVNNMDWRAALELGQRYRRFLRFDDAIHVLEPCVIKYCGRGSPLDARDRRRLLQRYYTSKIWKASDVIKEGDAVRGTELLESVVADTQHWRDTDDLIAVRAGLHAMSLRRLSESPRWLHDVGRKSRLLLQAITVYSDVFAEAGPQFFLVPELAELIEEFAYHAGTNGVPLDSSEFEAAAAFLAHYRDHLTTATNSREIAARAKLIRAVQMLADACDGGLLPGADLSAWTNESQQSLMTGASPGNAYVFARVYARVIGRPYLFAVDADGTQYFVSMNYLADPSEDMDAWVNGTLITGLPMGVPGDGRAIPLADVSRVPQATDVTLKS